MNDDDAVLARVMRRLLADPEGYVYISDVHATFDTSISITSDEAAVLARIEDAALAQISRAAE